MESSPHKISLGFTNQQFDPGIHICQIFNDDDERHSALINFIISGIKSGEKTACFSEKESENTLNGLFEGHGFDYKEVEKSGKFALAKSGEVYFKDGNFNPERMLDLLKAFYYESIHENSSGARVIGEMSPEIEKLPGGSRLLEYESKVSMLIKKCPVNAVCQYDARLFDGSTIMDVLKVHPYMVVRGSVVRNPFYIQPEEYLSNNSNNQ